jgi:hypothetical protein
LGSLPAGGGSRASARAAVRPCGPSARSRNPSNRLPGTNALSGHPARSAASANARPRPCAGKPKRADARAGA